MGWSESGRGCKHQYLLDHVLKQSSPGVCSSCLSERLSQLYAPSSTYFSDRVISTALSSPSDHSSVSSSASESPLPPRAFNTKGGGGGGGRHHRTASEMLGSMSFMIRTRSSTGRGGGGGDRGVMKKSRSMAVVSKISHFGDHLVKRKSGEGGGGKNKKGFWSKLLRTTGNRTREVLKHQRVILDNNN